MSEPRYYGVHLTSIDAEIFATRVGREAGAMYLKADARDLAVMRVMTDEDMDLDMMNDALGG